MNKGKTEPADKIPSVQDAVECTKRNHCTDPQKMDAIQIPHKNKFNTKGRDLINVHISGTVSRKLKIILDGMKADEFTLIVNYEKFLQQS